MQRLLSKEQLEQMLVEAEARDAKANDEEVALKNHDITEVKTRIATNTNEHEALMARITQLNNEIKNDQTKLARLQPSFAAIVGAKQVVQKQLFDVSVDVVITFHYKIVKNGVTEFITEDALIEVIITNYNIPVFLAKPLPHASIKFKDEEFNTDMHYLVITNKGTCIILYRVAIPKNLTPVKVKFSLQKFPSLKKEIDILNCSAGNINVQDISIFNGIQSNLWNELPSTFICRYVKVKYTSSILEYSMFNTV